MYIKLRYLLAGCIGLLSPMVGFSASQLTFDSNAKPTSLVLGDVDFYNSISGAGFYLYSFDGERVTTTKLTTLSTSGTDITVSNPAGGESFTFRINTYDNHVAIHLLSFEGIGTGQKYDLLLKLENSADVCAYTLNDLMTADDGTTVQLEWPYLWGRARTNGTHGSVVLYNDSLSGSARDAVLAEIWSAQGSAGHMVTPKVTSWMEADVMAWVDAWAAKHAKLVKVSVGPTSEAELYEMTDTYVIPSGANQVYMFSSVWRGEYKLDELSLTDVNTDIFPNGKSDLIAYSDYLAAHGAHLQLKSLAPSIGEYNPRYVSSTAVDHRLSSNGNGTLKEAVDTSATTLKFQRDTNLIFMDRLLSDKIMRIGEELIQVGTFSRTDDDVWVLEDCERGYGGSSPKDHAAGTEMAGVDDFYYDNALHLGDDFGAANSLCEEVLGEYGDFLDEVAAGHLHFDGSGQMNDSAPWGVRDYTDYIYSRQSRPTTGSVVGGSLPAHFERQFSAVLPNIMAVDYYDVRIGPRLHEEGSLGIETSTSTLDLHFDVSDRLVNNSRRPAFTHGRSKSSLTMDTLDNYGKITEAYELFQDWIKLCPVFTTNDAAYMRGFLTSDGSGHFKSEDVVVLSTNAAGQYVFTPHRVMGRTSGEDEYLTISQEWGTIPRFQDISAGTTMELYNPYTAQEPQVVIRVEAESTAMQNPLITINSTGTLSVTGTVDPGEYMMYKGGGTVDVYDENWNLQHTLPAAAVSFSVNAGTNTIETAAASGGSVIRVQYITLGTVYVLETNDYL